MSGTDSSDDSQPIGIKQKSPAKNQPRVQSSWLDKEKRSGSEEIVARSPEKPPAKKLQVAGLVKNPPAVQDAQISSKKRKIHDDSPEIEPHPSPPKEQAKKIKLPQVGSGSEDNDSDTEIHKRRQEESLKRIREKVLKRGRDDSTDSEDNEDNEKPSREKPRRGGKSKSSAAQKFSNSSTTASKSVEPTAVKSSSSEDDSKKKSLLSGKKITLTKPDSASASSDNINGNDKIPHDSDHDDSSANKSDNSDKSEPVKKESTGKFSKGGGRPSSSVSSKKSLPAVHASSSSDSEEEPTSKKKRSDESSEEISENESKPTRPVVSKQSKNPQSSKAKPRNGDNSKHKSRSSSISKGSDEEAGKKSTNFKKAPKSGKDSDDKLKRYKNYLKEAGIRINNYTKFFDGINSVKKQKEKILQHLIDNGLKGKPTVESCRKLREKRETAAEIASLDTKNIISVSGRTRGTAASNKPDDQKTTLRLRRPSEDSDDTDNDVDIGASAYKSDEEDDAFANLRDCIGSDSD